MHSKSDSYRISIPQVVCEDTNHGSAPVGFLTTRNQERHSVAIGFETHKKNRHITVAVFLLYFLKSILLLQTLHRLHFPFDRPGVVADHLERRPGVAAGHHPV